MPSGPAHTLADDRLGVALGTCELVAGANLRSSKPSTWMDVTSTAYGPAQSQSRPLRHGMAALQGQGPTGE